MGRIKKWADNKFGTYFMFAGEKKRNSFGSFEAAYEYLDREFSNLDTDSVNALSLHPLNSDVRTYSELEWLLRDQGGGATLREAVTFFLANHKGKRLQPRKVSECTAAFLEAQRTRNVSEIQLTTLGKHFRRFQRDFGSRMIHEITTLELETWLGRQCSQNGEPWSVKIRTSVRGSLVSMSLYAQEVLKSIPETGKTEFQQVRIPRVDEKTAVEIYSPAEMQAMLHAAIEHDIDLIPYLIVSGFCGLRPFEFHAEGLKRSPLAWEAFNWSDGLLHVQGQKIRSKATRDIPIQAVVIAWLEPFRELKGPIWRYTFAYAKKMIAMRKKAKVKSVYDGLRHSYASYRIRQLKSDLPQLAAEMGNSPDELIHHYKRNVTDADAELWFNVLPAADQKASVECSPRMSGHINGEARIGS